MTRINKIVCHGFKSFAKRTEMVFDGKFSCILGPNGSGKSNVLDALCFVLGKSSSKSLRAEKASNLIYNGGKMKNPAKWGEVSIYFDNHSKVFPSEMPEVKISRIVQQNGQSKYKINDETRTRQQVIDLLSLARINPDGYNIILQGDIIHFVEMPVTERRELIDEISGISVYEEKKHKALLELQKVDERLKEAEIVLAERGTYLKELKKDRDQALKYKEMNDNIKVNKASYLKLRIDRREKIKDGLDKRISEHKQKIDAIEEKITKLKQENEKSRQEIEALAQEVEKSGQGGQDGLNKQIEDLKIEHTKKATRIDTLKNEIKKIAMRKQELSANLDEVKAKIKELSARKEELEESRDAEDKTKKEIEGKIKKFKEKHNLESAGEIDMDIENLDKKIDEQQNEMMALRGMQQNLMREKDKVEYELNVFNDKVKKLTEIEKENKQQLDDLKQKRDEFKKITLELNKKLNEDSFMAAKIADKRKIVMKNVEELTKLEAKNMSIKANASVNIAIQKIQELKKNNDMAGIYGTISELGNVNAKYSTALEVAAGPKINSIVVEDDKVAASCIKYLKSNQLGTATFIPLNKIRGKEHDDSVRKFEDAKGAHGFAIDLIEFEPKFKKAFSYVFENTLVVDNIDTARRIGIGAAKMVTLDGDVTELSGAMQGGYRMKRKGAGFQEKELSGDIKKLEDGIAEINSDIKSLESAREKNDQLISEFRTKKGELEGEIIKIEKSLHLQEGESSVEKQTKDKLALDLKGIDARLDETVKKISKMNSELAQNKIRKQDLKSKISQLRAPTLIAELNTFEQKKNEVNEALIHLNNDIKNAENELNNIHKPELEKIDKIMKQHSKESEDFSAEIKTLSEGLKSIDKSLGEKEEEASKFYKKFRELFSKRGKINEEMSKNEMQINKKHDESRQIEIDMNTLSLDLARTNAELAGFYEEFKQYHGIELKLNKNEDEYKAEIAKFERMVASVGSVNMRALEIYEEVEKEFNRLNEKKDTLGQEKTKVEDMIKEIEGKKKEIFMDTFVRVNDNFKKIFSELSTKGEANLELENEEDPFLGGINIKVKIATNKFLDIKSLSGGEKTMTALAFIFSIQEHDPASFYVLDEVDAALDKRNADKLAKLVRKYSDNAQYIMISHNDQVISEADTLYGVSMNEHGISKVVGLKV